MSTGSSRRIMLHCTRIMRSTVLGSCLVLAAGPGCSAGEDALGAAGAAGTLSGGSTAGDAGTSGMGGQANAATGGTTPGTGGGALGGSPTGGGGGMSGGAGSGSVAGGGGSGSSGGAGGGGSGGAGGGSGSAGGGGSGGAAGFDPCPAIGDCKVLPLGDSITFGTPTNNGGYRVELFSLAVADGKRMTFVGSQMNGPAMVAGKAFPKNNEGYPGWTISQIDAIANSMKALKDAPHVVLLHIGTNDMVQSASGAPMRLGTLIDHIVTALPTSLLVVSSIIPLASGGNAVSTYNQAVPGVVQARASAGKHVVYVDQFKDFPTAELADGVHPNDAKGYPRMGRVWYGVIKPYLH
jgi:GDSL-like Lipase/Acylhydrolase family